MLNRITDGDAPWRRALWRHRAWLLVGLTLLFVLVVRVRLREILEEATAGLEEIIATEVIDPVPGQRECLVAVFAGLRPEKEPPQWQKSTSTPS